MVPSNRGTPRGSGIIIIRGAGSILCIHLKRERKTR
jgi:hypothetical protein